ncbi:hypothetical protein [Capnocytophaga canis]|uniref:Uncharacterized protein n=1 Tax=Capnocytophaga canis TaxID=1848903 RepID=A0A0B7ITR3_9FLAO|nr:hypothetical protein [Capnocytophaga canis]CEN53497.1 hypothetical protein CCAND93_450029 [Capnocytophaga canis]
MKSFCTKRFNLIFKHRTQRFGLPFYYTWDDFAENYPKNLSIFVEESPYNNEKLLKRQFLGLYTDFFRKDGDTYDFEVIKAISQNEDNEETDYYANIEDFSKYLFQHGGNLDIFSEFYRYRPLKKQITRQRTIIMHFTEFVGRVMFPFFEIIPPYLMYNHEILTNKYLYFTENVEKIVMFLQSNKTFEEWTYPNPTQEPQPENPKQSKTILINGRTPNLLERYLIADKTLNLEKALYALNVSEKERYKLLALVLGCNETNARLIMTGQYKTKTNEEEIKDFVNKYPFK